MVKAAKPTLAEGRPRPSGSRRKRKIDTGRKAWPCEEGPGHKIWSFFNQKKAFKE